ncbi:MAG: translation elongation factor Ts [Candidatus Omnitrophica bacterium CG1_02_49_10]|nr:MAG: translation elongation factor Ts [Candidatus Omnitrophica bacterium CG1_02_49_10]
MTISSETVKILREKTGAGIMDCKSALKESKGDMEGAVKILRQKGIETASKRASKAANQGIIASYVHMDSRIGVLVEINCETDFVARCDDFKNFGKDVAMQVAASNPCYVAREGVSKDDVEKELEVYKAQSMDKPAHVAEKIAQGKLDKFYSGICLMEQPFIREPKITIADHLNALISKVGENVSIKRFVRYQIGEEI